MKTDNRGYNSVENAQSAVTGLKRTDMKKKIAIIAAVLCLSACTPLNSGPDVYICTGRSATTYHSRSNCSGMSTCKGSIQRVSEQEAINMGRRPCMKCH